tara:strand:+ start:899 stop:1156 length:258 start_codon:yes stop_codon:yes gene_type:complete
MSSIDIVCNKEITNYFNCIEQQQNSTSHQTTICQIKIDAYYKCLDNKRYTECLLKKQQKERELAKSLLIESNKIDYQEYNLLSLL